MTHRLIYKLLAINLIVIGFAMAVVWLAIDTLAAGYFVTLMEKYHISPEPAHEMFVGAIHRYLIWASLAAVVLAVLLSYILTRRALGPLTRMAASTREIAEGHFNVRVPVDRKDEVGQLAAAFNHMVESLEKIETLRRSLMIDVAHELRTPLTNLRGYLEGLTDSVVPASSEIYQMLQSEADRLSQLVEDVLDLARADAAESRLRLEPVDLDAAIDTALSRLASAFSHRGIRVTVTHPSQPEAMRVAADHRRLNRVLRNLADNAARYAPAGSTVTVTLSADPRWVTAVFCNPAPDLEPTAVPYLFERFFRGERSRSRQHGGAGIGLAIVMELITAHGGTASATLADGNLCIRFRLPRTMDAPAESVANLY